MTRRKNRPRTRGGQTAAAKAKKRAEAPSVTTAGPERRPVAKLEDLREGDEVEVTLGAARAAAFGKKYRLRVPVKIRGKVILDPITRSPYIRWGSKERGFELLIQNVDEVQTIEPQACHDCAHALDTKTAWRLIGFAEPRCWKCHRVFLAKKRLESMPKLPDAPAPEVAVQPAAAPTVEAPSSSPATPAHATPASAGKKA